MFRPISFLLLICALTVQAAEPERQRAIGVNVDLLPTILSASAGEFGGALQFWAGNDHWRCRVVGARLTLPDGMLNEPDFRRERSTVVAVIADYTAGPNFDGVWVGAGVEGWFRRIELNVPNEPHTSARWGSAVATLGGGYIWKFSRHFYLDPWLGLHFVLDSKTVGISGHLYEPARFESEISVKLGWTTDI